MADPRHAELNQRIEMALDELKSLRRRVTFVTRLIASVRDDLDGTPDRTLEVQSRTRQEATTEHGSDSEDLGQ